MKKIAYHDVEYDDFWDKIINKYWTDEMTNSGPTSEDCRRLIDAINRTGFNITVMYGDNLHVLIPDKEYLILMLKTL